MTKPNSVTMPGWNVNIKHEREQSLFWHWVWSEMGKPYNGVVYNLKKRSRHTLSLFGAGRTMCKEK